ncbi:MAG: PilT/PilU family type 4a pilus ATPase [Vicinamibacteria bacterium]|nr:PilT/PilU family type 4a pilus ATPase [Vicinamibacteria bacterium]
MARLDSFLRLVAEQKASDLHFHSGAPPTIRFDGDLLPLPFRTLSDLETRRFLDEILTSEQKDILSLQGQVDVIYSLPHVGRFRGSIFNQAEGASAVFRVIPGSIPTLDDLGLPPSIENLARLQNGLVLVTGPTGSGKSTTLAALVRQINEGSARHIITVEDPIEYVHEPVLSRITQRQVGRHVESFGAALRSALREAPDVLVIGEMRDSETIQLALSAAETGVLVFGTLHTNTAGRAVDRILDTLSEDIRDHARGVLSVLLRAVIAQRLLRKSTGDGRVAAVEVLVGSSGLGHMIREGKTHQIEGLLQSANDLQGTLGFDNCLFRLARERLVAADEAIAFARIPDALRRRLGEMPRDDE